MPRPILLFTNGFDHLPFEELAAKAASWGYAGFELACSPAHMDVRRALADADYLGKRMEVLNRHDLRIGVLSNYKVGQAVCDRIDERHQPMLPEHVWGDGKPDGVRQRATEEIIATIQLARKLGVATVGGFTGSSLSSYVGGYPAASEATVQKGLREFARLFAPILEACREADVKYALEVHPGQIAFDLHSAEMVLDALHGAEEFGFAFDPSHLHWQGVEPVEFIRAFPNRIYHVHVKDAVLTLNGRSGILNGYLPGGDARRGFHFRAPGHGHIDWEAILRELKAIGYAGSLAVDYHDRGIDRETGARQAFQFVKGFDYLG